MRHLRYATLFMILWLVLRPVWSQDDIIASTTAESIFPQGMVFQFEGELNPGDTLALVTLSLSLPGAPVISEEDDPPTPVPDLREFVIPLEDSSVVQQEDNAITVTYTWLFNGVNDAPRVFTDVTYQWTVRTAQGGASQVEGTVPFADARSTWQVEPGPIFPITLAVPDGRPSPRQLLERVLIPQTLITQYVGPLENEIKLVVYNEDLPAGCAVDEDGNPVVVSSLLLDDEGEPLVLDCDLAFVQQHYARSGFDMIEIGSPNLFKAQAPIFRFVVEKYYADAWADVDLPPWFVVGFSRLIDRTAKIELLGPTLIAARNERLLSFDALQTEPPIGSDEYELWEAQSYGLVVYAASKVGLETIYALAAEVGDYASFEEAYAEIIGEPLSALYPAWELWLFSQEVPDVYAIDPFAEATSTPTPLPSATRQRSTRLPQPTPSPTPTRTPTLTRTPAPPSDTPTPTSTPFPTPIPVPAETEPTFAQTALQYVFLGVIVLALALFWVVFRRSGNKP